MEQKKVYDNLLIESAELKYRNFSGAPSDMNAAGNRNFNVVIPTKEQAEELSDIGWSIKVKQPKDENGDPLYLLKVKVSYEKYPPKIYLIAGDVMTLLTEDEIDQIDDAYILNADLEIRPYNWSRASGTFGTSAYLKTAYITIREEAFANKYKDFLFNNR